jgi:predicted metalloenzyme YecM
MSMKEIIGDYQAFFAIQNDRLNNLGIDISGCEISHLAYRTASYDEYLIVRHEIEKHCIANVENVWNGRPISKMLLTEPLDLGQGFEVQVIELIPPVHQRVYRMGMEHFGVAIGDTVDEFSRKHRSVLTGQQFQAPSCEPYYVTFYDDFTTVKFYRHTLVSSCEKEGQLFDGFYHVDNWPAIK